MGQWTLFSNHGHVLISLALAPKARLRDVAGEVGITERAVQKIIQDLEQAGYLEIRRQGRRNQYRINRRKHFRHAVESRLKIGQVLRLLERDDDQSEVSAQQTAAPSAANGTRQAASKPETRQRQEADSKDDEPQGSLGF